MIAMLVHNDAARFADYLAQIDPKRRCEAMANAIREAGGEYDFTRPTTAPAAYEISHMGIVGWGNCEDSAIQSWIRRARGAVAPEGRDQ